MSLLSEFKSFALRGNVVDMAVGIIIGSAFAKITSSLVSDVLMPPLGLLLGAVNFNDLHISLGKSDGVAEALTLNYGAFLQSTFDFLILAAAVFLVIKAMNTLKKAEDAPPAADAEDVKLLKEIRDLLKTKVA